MKKLLEDRFLEAFSAEWDAVNSERLPSDLAPYKDRSSWTKFMMGEGGVLSRVARRLTEVDPLLNHGQAQLRVIEPVARATIRAVGHG
jgi:hypothetical protein